MSEPPPRIEPRFDRRTLLRALPLAPFAAPLGATLAAALPLEEGSIVPFLERARPEPGTPVGDGLDGRLTHDPSRFAQGERLVANRDFYIRTKAPPAVLARRDALDEWTIRIEREEDVSGHFRDFGGQSFPISIDLVRERAQPMGSHLLECSGNHRGQGFGLLSIAEWSGMLLEDFLFETLVHYDPGTRILIRGNDDHSGESRSSVPGASWNFSFRQLRDAGAFFATEMNGESLPLDHGAPIRLVVPGWYGCCCIKWVEAVEVALPDAPATAQMREFATRTHQDGVPELARDFIPATIDFAAMPVLVRGPDADGLFQVTGIAWGDPTGVSRLEIRYRLGDDDTPSEWLPVPFVPQQKSSLALWQHSCRPPGPGEYEITLRVGDSGVRTRRLDAGDYARTVRL